MKTMSPDPKSWPVFGGGYKGHYFYLINYYSINKKDLTESIMPSTPTSEWWTQENQTALDWKRSAST